MDQNYPTDFSPDERSFLCSPHAEEALAAAGVLLEDLRPRSAESFDIATREMRSQAYESRRQYLWRIVREEWVKLMAEEEKRAKAAASSGGVSAARKAVDNSHETALRHMVQKETRALERELRAESQRERLERRQQAAAAARDAMQAEKEQQRALRTNAREFLGDMRAARRDLAAEASAREVHSARAFSARGGMRSISPKSSARGKSRPASASAGSLSEVVRQRAEQETANKMAETAKKAAQKDEALARRLEAVANERALKRLYAKQRSLRHEERYANVQLKNLEQTMKFQRELDERQDAAERERKAIQAAVGKVETASGEVVDTSAQKAEQMSKVAMRAAAVEAKKEQQRQESEAKERQKQERAEAARQQREREEAERAYREQVKNHEQQMRRQARKQSQMAAEEIKVAKIESTAELQALRSQDAKDRQERERMKKRMEQEVKAEMHRENAAMERRKTEYKLSQIEASINNKNLRYEQRRQTMEEAQQVRVAYSITRHRQQAEHKMSAEKELDAARSKMGTTTASSYTPDENTTYLANLAGSASTSAAASKPKRPSSGTARMSAGNVQMYGNTTTTTTTASVHSGGVASGTTGFDRDAERQRAAFVAIDRLRAEQNAELRHAVEAEQIAEAKRTELLATVPEGPDRTRLQKLLKLERERADSEMMALTADHERRVAELFKKASVSR